jgi:Holliday junction resolvasome RuvABC ATP-dependent DNA helicase subunit
VARQRSTKRIIYLRKEFCKMISNFDYKRIIFIDEVHVTSKDTSVAYGYFMDDRELQRCIFVLMY